MGVEGCWVLLTDVHSISHRRLSITGFGLRGPGFGFWASDFGFQVSGFGFRVDDMESFADKFSHRRPVLPQCIFLGIGGQGLRV
jgi:hypothetical protein